MRILIMLGVSVTLLLGCANTAFHRAELAKRAQTELIGMPKLDLLSCAGAPSRSERVGDVEFLTYVSGGDTTGYVAGGADSGGGSAVSMSRRYCEVTFVIRDGVVSKVNYTGRTGGLLTKGEQCGFVVENCLEDK